MRFLSSAIPLAGVARPVWPGAEGTRRLFMDLRVERNVSSMGGVLSLRDPTDKSVGPPIRRLPERVLSLLQSYGGVALLTEPILRLEMQGAPGATAGLSSSGRWVFTEVTRGVVTFDCAIGWFALAW